MRFTDGIQEFLEHKRAQRLSPRTLEDYEGTLEKFSQRIGDIHVVDIGVKDVRSYLASLTVSKKRVKNIHITFSSFWTWAVEENVCETHVPKFIKPPKPEKRAIVPISKLEVEALIAATDYCDLYVRRGKRAGLYRVKNARRDQAIIFLLLDTGMRASELCQLRMGDIRPTGALVHGKGSKDRIVPISKTTLDRLKKYTFFKRREVDDFVFLTKDDNPLTSDSLRAIIVRIAKRARLLRIHPHRFRHTFAINFLRNGGDIFSLQMILGHETLDMVRRYLAIAQTDIQKAHRKASPVENWGIDTPF